MLKRITIYGGLLILVAVAAYLVFHKSFAATSSGYEFATVSRGDIENTVSATGTLAPITSVDIGTQVSGTIDSVYVDYNDRVKEGQVLAVLDTTLLRASVLDAEASLERVQAQLLQAQVEYDRSKRLFDSSLVSDAEFLPYQVALRMQQASLKSAQVGLDRAHRNLQYAVIRSPISGVVINKNVEGGQTVAASLSTPTLFSIAEDLSSMEILADVDESDIGQIKMGQAVLFEVAAYMNKEFTGVVSQLRLQPRTVSNVVTYTVVVQAKNEEGLLLPGMTATITFTTEKHAGVLLIPSKAMRFQPSEKEVAAFRERRQKQMGNVPDSARAVGRGPSSMRQGMATDSQGRNGGSPRSMTTVWYLDSLGQLSAAPIRTGMTDKTNTEVVGSRFLTEGMKIIVGVTELSSTKTATPAGPVGGFTGPRMRGF
ncbi:MAG: efflux RND transporter periplasmic adaptor subunit [candidate division Zixibacteria bacterium]|nr:efflux RND transporter periplasmic adaptor subunit [candidate division Zixibacteria bacterium]